MVAESVPLSTSPTEALTQVTTVLSKASVYCAAHNPGLPEMSTLTVNVSPTAGSEAGASIFRLVPAA